MKDIQKPVQEAVDRLIASGAEQGLQVAVYRHGEPVADVAAGVADAETGRPVTPDTPFFSFSTGKGVTATVAHVLAERGLFDYETPIAELWPEFGVHGKDRATVRHALTHTAGVPGMPAETTVRDLADWDRMCAILAAAEPWWEPGTRTGYHAVSFGYLVGEIVRRATGKAVSQVLREEVAEPLGVAGELFFGVPESELGRVARLRDAEGNAELLASIPRDLPMFGAVPAAVMPTAEYGNRPEVLTSDIPSGGTMSARAVARMYAALLDEVDGVRLVSPRRLREISAVAFTGVDEIMGASATWALGYSTDPLGTSEAGRGERPTVFGMPGVGGSAACADTATGIAFAVTTNRFTSFGPSTALGHIGEVIAKAVADG
ncbi:serine hydrolase domain-containing protein [Streptosporangium carneum]|uniref:Esterase n=1 Tax=Streptosporangium carneum TaxID=47481 RepID=A0A9W6MF10_9ACTN|nr:serine hydrolase domain-containing protein [Streptosporangium carneum]GLK12159.1 esterase [Streptosporangium carneum]